MTSTMKFVESGGTVRDASLCSRTASAAPYTSRKESEKWKFPPTKGSRKIRVRGEPQGTDRVASFFQGFVNIIKPKYSTDYSASYPVTLVPRALVRSGTSTEK